VLKGTVLEVVLEVVLTVDVRGVAWHLSCCPAGALPLGLTHGPVVVENNVSATVVGMVEVVIPPWAATGPVALSAISAAIISPIVKTTSMRVFVTDFHLSFPFPEWSNSLFTLKTDPTTDSTTTLET